MSAFEDNSGKINSASFKEILLPYSGYARDEVLVGPKYGVDTSIVDLGNGLGMAVSSDPLTLIPSLGLKESAWLSVHLLANDMATTSFAPMYAQFVLNLPTNLSERAIKEYWKHIHQFCEQIGVNITGGHTGQIEGQNSTISGGGTMFLTAPLDSIMSSHHAGPGDVIVVTKETALNSSAILAMSFPETVKNKLGKEIYETACENFYRTSSLPDALAAVEVLEPNTELKALHDVTEGGVIGAICEMAGASDCGFILYNDKLPIGDSPYQITQLFDIDHRYCIGAGAMIMSVKKGKEQILVAHLKSKNIRASIVGEMTEVAQGFKIIEDDEEKTISFDGNDPYWGAFFKALKDGLK